MDQILIKSGPYKYIRHPGYSGLLLAFIGLSLSLQLFSALLIMIMLNIVTVGLRIRFEEKLIEKTCGQEYCDYKRKTKRLIPFIF